MLFIILATRIVATRVSLRVQSMFDNNVAKFHKISCAWSTFHSSLFQDFKQGSISVWNRKTSSFANTLHLVCAHEIKWKTSRSIFWFQRNWPPQIDFQSTVFHDQGACKYGHRTPMYNIRVHFTRVESVANFWFADSSHSQCVVVSADVL